MTPTPQRVLVAGRYSERLVELPVIDLPGRYGALAEVVARLIGRGRNQGGKADTRCRSTCVAVASVWTPLPGVGLPAEPGTQNETPAHPALAAVAASAQPAGSGDRNPHNADDAAQAKLGFQGSGGSTSADVGGCGAARP